MSDYNFFEDLTVEEQVLYVKIIDYAAHTDDIILSVFHHPNLMEFMGRNIEKIKQVTKGI